MTIEEIRKAQKSEPFRPFILHTADGRALSVAHPRFLLIVTGGETLVVASATSDDFTIIDLPYLTRLEVPANGTALINPESSQQPS